MKCLRTVVALGVLIQVLVPQTTAAAQCAGPESKLLASDGTSGDNLGHSVCVDGHVAVLGAPYSDGSGSSSGSAYITRFFGGSWQQEAKLVASDASSGDQYGFSVAIDGDVVVIGAPRADFGGVDSGAVYIYRFDGSAWVEEAKLDAAHAAAGDWFGWSVAIDGNVVLVGAPLGDSMALDSGSAYVYRHNGSAWAFEQVLTTADGHDNDGFGSSVSVDGDAALVGAFTDDVGAGLTSGSAYVFRDGGGTPPWTEEAKLTPPDGLPNDHFGWSVSVSGDVAVAGARFHDHGFGPASGAAYVYRHQGGGSWAHEQELLASDAQAQDSFGGSVSVNGPSILVGAHGNDDHGSNSGSAYRFRHDGSMWMQDCKITASDAAAGDNFGLSVCVSGEIHLVGASGEDDRGSDAGSAYVYDGVDGLLLQLDPQTLYAGDSVSLETSGGQPGGVVMLTVVDISGTAVFVKLAVGSFSSTGRWTLGFTVPSGLEGETVGLQSIGFETANRLGLSNVVTGEFQ